MNLLATMVKQDFPELWEGCSSIRSFELEGWYPMLYEMFRLINQTRKRDSTPFSIRQIKEKFGTLRIYASGSEEHEQIISMAEHASSSICAFCSNPGKIDTTSCWHLTRCDAHKGMLKPEVDAQDETHIRDLASKFRFTTSDIPKILKLVKVGPDEFSYTILNYTQNKTDIVDQLERTNFIDLTSTLKIPEVYSKESAAKAKDELCKRYEIDWVIYSPIKNSMTMIPSP